MVGAHSKTVKGASKQAGGSHVQWCKAKAAIRLDDDTAAFARRRSIFWTSEASLYNASSVQK